MPRFEVRDGPRRLTSLSFADLPTGYPFTAMVPQSDTEAVLRDRLAELGVEVEWGIELVALEQDPGGVTVRLARGGPTEEWRASMVLGADGLHSRTRELLGIGFPGATYESSSSWPTWTSTGRSVATPSR